MSLGTELGRCFVNVWRSAFIKNVLLIMSGSALAQGVGFVLAPVISRLFSPADFGVFGSFGAATGVALSFVTLDYAQAIMLPKRKDEAGQLLVLSCVVTLLNTLLCLAGCVLVPGLLLALLKSQDYWLLYGLALGVLAGGLNSCFQSWCVRVKAFADTSVSQVVRGLAWNGLQIGFGTVHAGALGLVASSVVADALASLNLLRVVKTELRRFIAVARWRQLISLAREYYDFPAYSASQNLLNAVSTGLPVLLLSHYYGIAVGGAYAFSMRFLGAPVSLVTGALRQVLFQKAGETQHHDQPLAPLFFKSTLGLFVLGIVPTAALFLWAPAGFGWLFGPQWNTAGEFARYLVLWLFFAFCNQPAVLFGRLIRVQRSVFLYNVVVLLARAAILVAGGHFLGPLDCLIVFSVAGALLNLYLILFVGCATLKHDNVQSAQGRKGLVPLIH